MHHWMRHQREFAKQKHTQHYTAVADGMSSMQWNGSIQCLAPIALLCHMRMHFVYTNHEDRKIGALIHDASRGIWKLNFNDRCGGPACANGVCICRGTASKQHIKFVWKQHTQTYKHMLSARPSIVRLSSSSCLVVFTLWPLHRRSSSSLILVHLLLHFVF